MQIGIVLGTQRGLNGMRKARPAARVGGSLQGVPCRPQPAGRWEPCVGIAGTDGVPMT